MYIFGRGKVSEFKIRHPKQYYFFSSFSKLEIYRIMAAIRQEFINAAIERADALKDSYIHNDISKRHEFVKQIILDDESLTIDERTVAIKIITENYDYFKILLNEGIKRLCESSLECFATSYCEHCARTYLKNDFSSWTSGNTDIDDLIQECQMESFSPGKIIEWIPYNNLQDVKYMTKGGCSEIYSANWIDGPYDEWNSKEQRLERLGTHKVILKKNWKMLKVLTGVGLKKYIF